MASNTNIGVSQQGPGRDIGASQTAVAIAVAAAAANRRTRTLFLFAN